MKIRFAEWASIAEVASAIAVVATLLVLIASVRDGTAVTRAATYQSLIEGLNEMSLLYVQDDRLLRVWKSFLDGKEHDLSEDDQFRLQLILRTVFRNLETAYYWNRLGVLSSSEWTRFEAATCRSRSRLTTEDWKFIQVPLTTDFREYVERACEVTHAQSL